MHNRPDIVVWDNQNKTITITEVAVAWVGTTGCRERK